MRRHPSHALHELFQETPPETSPTKRLQVELLTSTTLKPSVSITAILVIVASIVGVSVASAVREQRRLLAEFTSATQGQVHAAVDLLSARLDALDQDTRLLINLVEESRRNKDLDLLTEGRIWTAAFQALATVVPQYRTICLFRADGALDVIAVDPTEAPHTVDALVAPSRRLAIAVSASQAKALARPATRYRDRSFLLYATPVAGGGAVVVASDAAIFLGGMAWNPLAGARLFVTDPAGIVWSGCETTRGCRSTDSPPVQNVLSSPVTTTSTIDSDAAANLGLGHNAALRISEQISGRLSGSWTVTWLTSLKAILDRERSLLFRLVATTMAAALAVAAIGVVMLRQQRKSVGLASQLKVTQALASARETSEAIVESAPLGVLGVSQTGTVVLVNRFLTTRLGSIHVGAHLDQAFCGEGADWISELAPFLLVATTTEGALPEMRQVNTKAHQFHVRIVPVRNHELGIRAFALVEDQSELRNLENHLLRAEKLITVGVLSAGIAHEVGSPLAVIRGRAEQVLRHVGDGAPGEDLRVIIKHIDNISSTIRQLLDFSRRQPIARRAVSVASAVERAKSLVHWKIDARSLELRIAIPAVLPDLAADPDQLQQVLVNLLLNACDASDAGQVISLTADAGNADVSGHADVAGNADVVRLKIADRGCGIAPEHMNAVFDPFFTTKKRGEGTGLGLPIAASIVRNHAGEINLTSAPGKGTTVTILWPAVSAAPLARELHA